MKSCIIAIRNSKYIVLRVATTFQGITIYTRKSALRIVRMALRMCKMVFVSSNATRSTIISRIISECARINAAITRWKSQQIQRYLSVLIPVQSSTVMLMAKCVQKDANIIYWLMVFAYASKASARQNIHIKFR